LVIYKDHNTNRGQQNIKKVISVYIKQAVTLQYYHYNTRNLELDQSHNIGMS